MRFAKQMILNRGVKTELQQASEVSQMRGARVISAEDILFLMRKDKKKLRRLLKYMFFRDYKSKIVKGIEEDDLLEDKPGSSSSGINKRQKIAQDFLISIDQTGELLSLFEDDEVDDVKQARMELLDDLGVRDPTRQLRPQQHHSQREEALTKKDPMVSEPDREEHTCQLQANFPRAAEAPPSKEGGREASEEAARWEWLARTWDGRDLEGEDWARETRPVVKGRARLGERIKWSEQERAGEDTVRTDVKESNSDERDKLYAEPLD
ncbi:UNVERIFIED_CONTAM: hypothetical protein K2H54_040870 [Gekko kuhli]